MNQSQLTNSRYNEEGLLLNNQLTRMKLLKNSFILTAALEILVLILQFFALAFYQWYHLGHRCQTDASPYKCPWFQLIYVYIEKDYVSYSTFCDDYPNDICNDTDFKLSKNVGYLIFLILCFCNGLVLLDVIKMLLQLHSIQKWISKWYLQSRILHVISMIGYLASYLYLLLQVFILNKFHVKNFGSAFWTGFGSLAIYLICIVYYRITRSRLQRALYIDKMINNGESVEHVEFKSMFQSQEIQTLESEYKSFE